MSTETRVKSAVATIFLVSLRSRQKHREIASIGDVRKRNAHRKPNCSMAKCKTRPAEGCPMIKPIRFNSVVVWQTGLLGDVEVGILLLQPFHGGVTQKQSGRLLTGTSGWQNSPPLPFHAGVTQLAECSALTRYVVGSSPAASTICPDSLTG